MVQTLTETYLVVCWCWSSGSHMMQTHLPRSTLLSSAGPMAWLFCVSVWLSELQVWLKAHHKLMEGLVKWYDLKMVERMVQNDGLVFGSCFWWPSFVWRCWSSILAHFVFVCECQSCSWKQTTGWHSSMVIGQGVQSQAVNWKWPCGLVARTSILSLTSVFGTPLSTLCVTVRAAAESGPQADGGTGQVVQPHSGDVDWGWPQRGGACLQVETQCQSQCGHRATGTATALVWICCWYLSFLWSIALS